MSPRRHRATAEVLEAGPDADVVPRLVALGVDRTEAEAAVAEDRVALVLARRLLDEPQPYTVEDVARKTGVSAEFLRRCTSMLGIERRFGPRDVAEARLLRRLLEFVPEDVLIREGRILDQYVERIAMSDVLAVEELIIRPMRESGADEVALAVALADAAKQLLPISQKLLVAAHRRALVRLLESELVQAAARHGGQEVELAVGFVDLVGYTALSARIDPAGLNDVLAAFERRVFDVATQRPAVNLVKFLGDAAMFVAVNPVELAGAVLEVIEVGDELADAPLRGGIAAGATLLREGDYFGPPVNLAARLTDRARPATLLADEELRPVLDGSFEVHRTPPMRIRGVGLRRPLSVRPLAA